MHGALNHEDQTQVEHEQQAESVEDVEETGCPEDVKKHIDFRWDFNSCVIGQLGEAQSQCSVIPIATKLAHGCTHGKHHHYNWHELTTNTQSDSVNLLSITRVRASLRSCRE